jgi:hypothetical protein
MGCRDALGVLLVGIPVDVSAKSIPDLVSDVNGPDIGVARIPIG